MQLQLFGIAFLAIISVSLAVPTFLVEDEEGQEYHLTPVLNREKRQAPVGFGGGSATGKSQGGAAGFVNPNGSGGKIGYGHQNGYGHGGSIDARVPVWSNKGRHGDSTLSAGGGVSGSFGGPGGARTSDKRVGINFNHRF